jgi:hypothetical protein
MNGLTNFDLMVAVAVPYEFLVPEHTQYALFQLYCDLRANPIKDRHFLEIHAKRLKPHTFPGWIVSTLPPFDQSFDVIYAHHQEQHCRILKIPC